MKSRAKIALGVDISPHQISAALVERAGKDVRVLAAASCNLPDSAAQPGSVEQAKALSRTIKRLGRRARGAGVKATVSLSANPLVIQILDMPRHMPANLHEFVESELKQYVTLSGKRIASDFCGIGPAVEGRKRMLTAAAEREQVLAVVNACTRAGVTVEAVEPSLLAYARAFHASVKDQKDTRNALIAILGSGSLTVSLFRNSVLDFVRTRDIPAGMVTHDSLFEWLAEELKAVIRYHDGGAGADHGQLHAWLIVQGQEPPAKALELSLRATMGAKSPVVTDSHGQLLDSATDGEDAPAEVPSRMAVGAGLKILNADADDLKINLLPEEVRRARSFARHALLTAIAAAATFVIVLVAMLLLDRTAGTARQRVEKTKVSEQLYTTRALIAQDKFLDHESSRVQKQLGPLQKFLGAKHQVDWSAVLNALKQAAPAGVCITELSSGANEGLTLKGLALSCEAAQAFARHLDGSEPFASASMAKVATKEQGGRSLVEYQIDCAMSSAGGGK
jgi:Tfp pilus assembly protein PilN